MLESGQCLREILKRGWRMNAKEIKKPGKGQKECVSCKAVIGARSLKCEKCGAEQLRKAPKTSKTTSNKSLSLLSIDDFKLILRLAEQIKSGKGIAKPSNPKPTLDDFAAVAGDIAKSKELKAVLGQWRDFEATADVPEKVLRRIQEAIGG